MYRLKDRVRRLAETVGQNGDKVTGCTIGDHTATVEIEVAPSRSF